MISHPPDNRFAASLRVALVASLAIAALAFAACGDDEDGDEGGETAGVSFKVANQIKDNTSRAAVTEQLGTDPAVSAGPTDEFPGGCDYYPMQSQPPTSVWQFCFGENDRLTDYGPEFSPADRPPPPEDASDERLALLGGGDAICQSDYAELATVTKRVGEALTAFQSDASGENRDLVGASLDDFIANLEGTQEGLSAFEAPEDGSDALTAYLDSLESQIEVLTDAKAAFLDGNIDEYDKLGDEFTQIGEDARNEASTYGFAVCSASDFG